MSATPPPFNPQPEQKPDQAPTTFQPAAPQKPNSGSPQTSGLAVVSLVTGILSLVCNFITGIIAVITGALAISKINKSNGALGGKGMAIAGVVMGILGCLLIIPIVFALLLPAVAQIREVARMEETRNNMREISFGMHSYSDTFRKLPPSEGSEPDRGTMLSWRVAILPFINQNNLYELFNHNEPWDSPHNLALLEKMPDVYASLNHELEPGYTQIQVPVASSTTMTTDEIDPRVVPLFIPGQRVRLESILDGLSQTIMVLEVNPNLAVPWTAPQDWEFDYNNPLRGLGDARPQGFIVAYADGSVFTVSGDVETTLLRSRFTPLAGD